MRVRLMQVIDYWVGVPLCSLCTVWRRLVNLFSPPTTTKPKKLLFIELSEMGSAIIAYSMLKRAKDFYSDGEQYFLIFRKNAESCEILNVIPKERILTIDDRDFVRFALSTLAVIVKIRSLGIDTVIDMELFSRATALITYLTGAPNRVGFHRGTNEGLYRGVLLTHEVPYNPHIHIALNFMALLGALESDANSVPLVKADHRSQITPIPALPISEADAQLVEKLLRAENPGLPTDAQLVVMNPDPGDALPIRGWPMERFVAVGKELLERFPKVCLVVIGLKRSKPYAEAFQKVVGTERCLDLTGKTPNLRAVVALMARSRLLISNDSGPGHLATLTNIHGIVLFGPETPALYGPLSPRMITPYAEFSCSPCLSALNHRYTKCNNNVCLQVIPVSAVLNPACELLESGAFAKVRNPALRVLSEDRW